MTPSEILNAAADLLEKPGAWTQGAYARDADGRATDIRDSEATCFCLRGAIYRVGLGAGDVGGASYRLDSLVGSSAMAFNDHPERTQAEVVAALRQAAESA